MKPTKRQAFNFLRSYFDVLNKIQSDEDKLNFLLSVINKQFLDENPKDLNFIVELSYESQRHAIEKSIKGYKDKKKTDLLGNPTQVGNQDPKQDPYEGCKQDPRQQEEEKEKEKEKEEEKEKAFSDLDKFLKWYSEEATRLTNKKYAVRLVGDEEKTIFAELNTKYSFEEFKTALNSFFSESSWHKTNELITPKSFLKIDNFNKYLNAKGGTNETLQERAARLMKEEMNR